MGALWLELGVGGRGRGSGTLGIRDRKGGKCLIRNVNGRHGGHMCRVLREHLLMVEATWD